MPPSQDNPTFGRYTLISKLGMGGMAEVYKANRKGSPDAVFAIKRILPQFMQDKKLVGMLVNEARLSLGLNHPNIVPVVDFGMVDGNYFIAMEYVRGKDLKSIMIRCKTRNVELPVQMSVYIMSQVLRALEYAHTKRDNYDKPLGIVHRDISPHNVLISLWGEVKILDFGIAKASTVAGSTQAGILKGKFSYMSPEQARGEDVDHRTDVFSSGIVLWELLTLESLYQAESDIKLLAQVREALPRDPSQVNSKVPKALSEIVLKALEKKARKRFQSAGEFVTALDAYQNEFFGTVTDADVGAFVRSLFGIPTDEILQDSRPSIRSTERSPSETLAPSVIGIKKPPLRFPGWLAKGAFLATAGFGIAWGLHRYPPHKIYEALDRRVARLAKSIHHGRGPGAQPSAVRIDPPVLSRPPYALYFAPGVKESMEDLPFEIFDRLRAQMDDLRSDPKPSRSKAVLQRPGFRQISLEGYRLVYTVNDQPKTVMISAVEKSSQRGR
ncbi:MAG: protein kinase [Pseudomonadota bacterium]